jgi:tetratricopeptide (TPR) repeat protein
LQLLEFRTWGECFLPLFLVFLKSMAEKDKELNKIENAQKLLRQGQYRKAIKIFEEINKAHPKEESVLLMLAWAYYDSGAAQKAIECLNILLERELQRKIFTGFAFDELVRIYKQEKNFNKLVEICKKAITAQPENIGLLVELGNSYLQLGEAKEACGIYEKIIGMEDDNPAFYCLWGEALFAAGLFLESEEAYIRAGKIDPEQAANYCFKLTVLFQQAEEHNEAIRLINKCIALSPGNPLYYCSLGDSLISLGQIEQALKVYEKAVQYGGHNSTGAYCNRLGNMLMKAKYFSQAAAAFEKAIKYENRKPYYLGLISAYRAMGLEDEADKVLREVEIE